MPRWMVGYDGGTWKIWSETYPILFIYIDPSCMVVHLTIIDIFGSRWKVSEAVHCFICCCDLPYWVTIGISSMMLRDQNRGIIGSRRFYIRSLGLDECGYDWFVEICLFAAIFFLTTAVGTRVAIFHMHISNLLKPVQSPCTAKSIVWALSRLSHQCYHTTFGSW